MKTVLDKFTGTIIGSALGDAIGKCVEDVVEDEVVEFYGGRIEGFVSPHPSSPAAGQAPEEVSDETTVSVILLESIISRKCLDVSDFLKRLILWYEDETRHRYPDPVLLTSIDLLSRNINPSDHGITSGSVEGILRSVIVGLFHYPSPQLAVESSRLVSLLTHRGEAIAEGSALLGAAISYLVLEEFNLTGTNEKIRFLNTLKGFMNQHQYRKTLDTVQDLILESADLDMAIRNLGNGSYVFEALPLSLFIFLSNVETPLEALWWAVNSYGEFGGDTDSIGYIVGALIGACWGLDPFPPHLVENLENSAYYKELAKKLYDITENMIIRR